MTEIEPKDELIAILTQEGLDAASRGEGLENLKKGMKKVKDQIKVLTERYTQISEQVNVLIIKDVENVYKNKNAKLQKLLQMIHEKNLKAKEAYKQEMGLYQGTIVLALGSWKASV